jgi:hypothetical protein
MKQSSRIESLSYGMIYGLGCLVSAFLSVGQGGSIEQLVMHALASWGYVIYYVMNVR